MTLTDRVKGLYVALDKDYRVDDIEEVVSAIKMIKCVNDVALNVVHADDWINRSRISLEYKSKLYKTIQELNE